MISNPGPSGLAIEPIDGGVGFWIHVQPGARTESVGPEHGEALRVAVGAPAVEGRANAACVAALASALGLPRTAIQLAPSSRGRRKRVRVMGDPAQLRAQLHALATER